MNQKFKTMITRIKIDGFKSLVNSELYFGPFTCIIGANAIGKSNFFDALVFLSNLADKTLIEAAKSIRSEKQSSNINDMFFRNGEIVYDTMSFEVDMIIPQEGYDDLGQRACTSTTAVRYKLQLRSIDSSELDEPIQILSESLEPIPIKEIRRQLYFAPSKEWISSVIKGRKNTSFISTSGDNIIKLHLDSGGDDTEKSNKRKRSGRPIEFQREKMPRTLLSTVTAEFPTACLVRQEMRNWMMLQLEPTSLRQPNTIYDVKHAEIKANGANIPATLYRLHNENKDRDIYQEITNKIKKLIPEISEIWVDRDDKRDLLTLETKFKNGLTLPAQSLSDGTLRFMGLTILQADYKSSGVICLEEPENGINPKKITEMIELLQEIATDTTFAVDQDNPLRQIIINTHSTIVASNISLDDIYFADNKELYNDNYKKKILATTFSALPSSWRVIHKLASVTSVGEIDNYVDGKIGLLSLQYVPSVKKRIRTIKDIYKDCYNLWE